MHQDLSEMLLSNVVIRQVFHVLPSSSFYEAVKMPDEMKIGCLAVVDDGKKHSWNSHCTGRDMRVIPIVIKYCALHNWQ